MPELPEVETIVRSLAPRLTGRRILSAIFSSKLVTRGGLKKVAARLAGKTILSLKRHGKHIVFQLDSGVLTIHLGMTGKLLLDGAATPYTRGIFRLDRSTLLYDDVRQFGRIDFSEQLPERVERLGPDALVIEFDQFYALLKARKARIKSLLLNQSVLSGMGNIYTDEALFRARIHPTTNSGRLGRVRAQNLHRAMVEVLTIAIASKGSSISDYVDADGASGSFQLQHLVYGRADQPCSKCGTPIRRIVVAQRGTHYCPRCQRA